MSLPRRRAVYAGTFDPITNGHKDIITRAAEVFEEVVVAVAEVTRKELLFSTAERLALVNGAISDISTNVKVESFAGLLVDYVRNSEAKVVVRGLRAVSDYEYESQMAMINRQMAPEVETVFLMTADKCSYISSSVVKEIAQNGGDVSTFVPENVSQGLKKAFSVQSRGG